MSQPPGITSPVNLQAVCQRTRVIKRMNFAVACRTERRFLLCRFRIHARLRFGEKWVSRVCIFLPRFKWGKVFCQPKRQLSITPEMDLEVVMAATIFLVLDDCMADITVSPSIVLVHNASERMFNLSITKTPLSKIEVLVHNFLVI